MDDFPARLVIVPGEPDRLLASGWEVGRASGPGRGGRALERGRRAGQGGHAGGAGRAPGGRADQVRRPVRAHAWRSSAARRWTTGPAFSPYGNRFVTGDIGHGARRLPGCRRRGRDGVLHRRARASGCATRWRMPPELFGRPAGGPPAMMRFLGCNPRHHSLALAPMTSPAGIVHLMIEVATLDDVGRAMDRCARRGGTAQRHARPARQRPDGLVLRADAGRVRHRVRHRRAAGRRRDLGEQGDDRGQPLGPRLRPVPRRALRRTPWAAAARGRGDGGATPTRRVHAGELRAGTAQFRQVLGHFCTGITVITGYRRGRAGRFRLPGLRGPVA